MRIEEISVGEKVLYAPRPDAEAEVGEVTEIRRGGVMVQYASGGPKYTAAGLLSPVFGRGH